MVLARADYDFISERSDLLGRNEGIALLEGMLIFAIVNILHQIVFFGFIRCLCGLISYIVDLYLCWFSPLFLTISISVKERIDLHYFIENAPNT